MTGYETDHKNRVREIAPECMVLLKSDGSFPLAQAGQIALYGNLSLIHIQMCIRDSPRTIPYMNKIPKKFTGIQTIRDSGISEADWNRMLAGEGTVTVAPHSKEIVEINAGELMTGFLKLAVRGGKETKIKILQSESYYLPKEPDEPENTMPVKGDRTDDKNGHLLGVTDTYEAVSYTHLDVYKRQGYICNSCPHSIAQKGKICFIISFIF